MEYFNFALNIEATDGGGYEVHAQSETMGEAKGTVSFALSAAELAAAQERLANGPVDRDFLTSFGGMLTDALFAGEIRDIYRESLGRVQQEKGLRIRLCMDPPALSALPWELAYDRSRDTFLATSSETPLTRYISLHEPIDQLTTSPPVSVLVAIPDSSGLDVAMERAIIEDALSELGDAVTVTVLDGHVTRSAISDALLARDHHIFHFIGHGEFTNNDGFLKLNADDPSQGDDLMAARPFAGFFRGYPSMKLVVLNSCQGAAVAATRPLAGIAPQLVRAGIPAVVAMQYPFADNAALLFAREFYLTLCTGRNRGRVDAAISHARNRLQMDFADTTAFATPVLYMRSPTGVIFDLAAARAQGQLLTPRADIDRLKEVKKAYQSNIRILQAVDTGDAEATTAQIKKEGAHIADIDGRLRSYYVGIGGFVLASWAVLFASWIGLFNAIKLDDWLERTFVGYMDAFVTTKFDRRVSLILGSDDPAKNGTLGAPSSAWRCHHAQLLSGLSAAKASVVAFDMYFEDASECDQQFADAIRQASAAGTGVVVGVREFDPAGGIPAPLIAPLLAAAVQDQWGILEGSPVARRVRLAAPITENRAHIQQQEAGVVPSVALRALMHLEAQRRGGSTITAAIDRDHGRIRLRDGSHALIRSIPVVDDDMNMIVGVASRQELGHDLFHELVANASHPDRLARFKGKVVVIGYTSPDDRWDISAGLGEPRYGVELQASAISNLLGGVAIRPLGTSAQYLVIVIMGLAGALIRRLWRGGSRLSIPVRLRSAASAPFYVPLPLIAVVVVYALVAFLVYKQYRLIFDISYHIVSLLFVYAMIGWVQRGGREKALARRA
jgi:CHASE2 domain-containing sensor protein